MAKYTPRRCAGENASSLEFPEWVNEEFIKELQLKTRAREAAEAAKGLHPWHPRAVASFTTANFTPNFEQWDRSNSETPLSWRYPYFDLRVLSFLLSVPTRSHGLGASD